MPETQHLISFPQATKIFPFKVRVGWISSTAELDAVALAFQNKKLAERLAYRDRTEAGLRKRMEQFQVRRIFMRRLGNCKEQD
ncbi:MAG: hypothetical protein AAF357_19755 [Verrucomicrobiota bacterium]